MLIAIAPAQRDIYTQCVYIRIDIPLLSGVVIAAEKAGVRVAVRPLPQVRAGFLHGLGLRTSLARSLARSLADLYIIVFRMNSLVQVVWDNQILTFVP